jgi:hypothetical protein
VIRRQLIFLFVIACAVSLSVEGRVVPWAVFDAGVSFLFIPVFQLLAFFLVWRVRIGRARAGASDVAAFLDGNTPWLWWWCAFAAMIACVPPRSVGLGVTLAEMSTVIPFAVSAVADVRWLRRDHGRTMREAATDVAVLRAVTWGAGLVWFFGIAVWYLEVPKVVAWLRG